MTAWGDLYQKWVLFEDDAVLALNKPSGLSVMGERHDTDIVTLAKDAGVQLYPAHRIDKVTTGLVLFAKKLDAHGSLTRQFAKRTAEKSYLAVVQGTGLPGEGTIDLPLSEGRKNKVRIAAPRASIATDGNLWFVPESAILAGVKNYPSTSTFTKLAEGDHHTLLRVHPLTGRRHQIRVHLAWIGYPIEGDPLFIKNGPARTFLHSWRLTLELTPGEQRTTLEAPIRDDFLEPLALTKSQRDSLVTAMR